MVALNHKPVLLDETIRALNLQKDGIYVDATFGGGGYSKAILKRKACKIIAIDRDPESFKRSYEIKKQYKDNIIFVEGLFSNLKSHLKKLKIHFIHGIVFDFGISSIQLDDPKRGFSFKKDGPLDMRMSPDGVSAYDIVNDSSEKNLNYILKFYGEEKRFKLISKAIISKRPIKSTKELAEIIYSVIGRKIKGKIDPATKSFQAIRIAVNNELNEIKYGIRDSIEFLIPGGRIAAVSFHSLEDRIVKLFFKNNLNNHININNRHLPETDRYLFFKQITKKPTLPSYEETIKNPRSRSAKLRVAERTTTPFTNRMDTILEKINA